MQPPAEDPPSHGPSLLVHARLPMTHISTEWDRFQGLLEPISRSMPCAFAPGNHEIEPYCSWTTFAAFNARFRMPYTVDATSGQNLWWATTIGPARFIFLSSFSDYSKSSPQYAFLAKELKAYKAQLGTENQTASWLIVLFHVPLYNTNKVHQGEGEDFRKALEPLIAPVADVIYCGHVHAYERTTRVYDYQVNDDAPFYVNIGAGGNREGPAKTWLAETDWSVVRTATFGHGELTFTNATHALWEWHANIDSEGVVMDSVVFQSRYSAHS